MLPIFESFLKSTFLIGAGYLFMVVMKSNEKTKSSSSISQSSISSTSYYKSKLSAQLTNELKENFASFGNVKDLNLNEKLWIAKKKLGFYDNLITDFDNHKSFIIEDKDIETFSKISKAYVERIQIDLLDAIQRDLGATSQQIAERKTLNQKATKIKEMLDLSSPSPRYSKI